jgi:hypothetical protein
MTLAGTARADWVKYLDMEFGLTAKYYYDPTTIRRQNDMVLVWVYSELSEPMRKVGEDGEWEQSFRTHYEIDCKHQRRRALRGTTFSGPMMSGEIVNERGVGEWKDASSLTLLKILCK